MFRLFQQRQEPKFLFTIGYAVGMLYAFSNILNELVNHNNFQFGMRIPEQLDMVYREEFDNLIALAFINPNNFNFTDLSLYNLIESGIISSAGFMCGNNIVTAYPFITLTNLILAIPDEIGGSLIQNSIASVGDAVDAVIRRFG